MTESKRMGESPETSVRKALIETALEMNRRGLNSGTSGNVSARFGSGMLITPSGMPYESLEPADLVYVDERGEPSGSSRPSSEWRFHHDIYRERTEAAAIVHAHPRHCTSLACLGRPMPAFHYMVAVAGGVDIRCAGYATFGTQELSDLVIEALHERKACLMANHGLVAFAKDPLAALDLACEIEHLAASYLQCLAVGEPNILDDAEMQRVLTKFSNYGPVRQRP